MSVLEPNTAAKRDGVTWKWSNDHTYHSYADGGLNHDYFVGAIEHLITNELPDVSDDLEAYAEGHGNLIAMYKDMRVPGIEDHRPDIMVEKFGEACFIGEAKGSKDDLCDRNHTNPQMDSYISYLYNQHEEMKHSKPSMRFAIIMGVPFCLSSEARRVFRSSVMRLSQADPEGFGMSNPEEWLEILIATELDGKDIPDPSRGFDDGDPLTENFPSRYTFDHKTYRCSLGYMDINSLTLDPHNVRFKDDREDPDQKECMRRLLTEGDVTSDKLNMALERKRTIIDDGNIHEPLDVFIHDVNGVTQNLVVEGNSRLANCKDIVERANSAPSYRIVPVRKFFEHDGITEEMMDDIKEHEQNKVVLPHDNARIAIDIADMLDSGKTCDDVRRRYSHLTKKTDGEITEYADAIHRARVAGCDPDYITSAYSPVWSVIVAVRNCRNTCNFKGFDMDIIVRRLVKEVQDGGKFGTRYSNLISAIGSKRKNQKQETQLRRWVQGEYESDEEFGEEWRKNGRYDKSEMKSSAVRGNLESILSTLIRADECIRTLYRRPGNGMRGRGGYNESSIEDLSRLGGDISALGGNIKSLADATLRDGDSRTGGRSMGSMSE